MVAIPLTTTYATAGTYTWFAPPGVTSVTVACQGAGGGGGAASATSGSNGGGGGGGEAAAEAAVAVTPGTGYALTVGTGGGGGAAGGNGIAGTASSFTGDAQTVTANGGGAGSAGVAGDGQPGAGGAGSVNSLEGAGGNGDAGTVSANGGGGGGAGGISLAQGFPGSPGSGSAAGAASGGTWPGGGGGAGATTGAAGSNGSGPGGGGGGALSTGTATSGGNGADGQVLITWTANDPVTLANATPGGVTKYVAPLGVTAVKAEAWGGGAGGFNTLGSSGAVLVGATLDKANYPGQNDAQTITTFDGFAGRLMGTQISKIYTVEASWPSNVPSKTAAVIATGAPLVVAVKPSRSQTAAEKTNLKNYLNLLLNHGASIDSVILWQECNGKDATGALFFASAGAYTTYVNFYAATVRALGLPLAFNPILGGTTVSATAYYPGDSNVDKIYVDYYGTGYNSGARLDDIAATADAHSGAPISLGLGEWNANAGGTPLTTGQWNTYTNYLISYFSTRQSAGKPIGPFVFWMGASAATGSGVDQVLSAGDFKVPQIQKFYDTFSTGPAGGAGGGGGEYAAEPSLVISSPAGVTSYTLTVGAGGAGRVAGANTTVPGDSVTVTGHGGAVATSVSTGGAAGTGSGNTTHNNGGAGGGGGVSAGGGGGGGSSGGTAAAGNAGGVGGATAGGAGGAAVTGGGPGGAGAGPSANGFPPVSGPGGGGGGRGASGLFNGAGADGQITLSNFVIHPASTGGLGLAPLAMSGTGTVGGSGGNFALAPLALSSSGTVAGFILLQTGAIVNNSGGSITPLLPLASTMGTLLIAEIVPVGTTASTGPAGWLMIGTQTVGGTGGSHCELWMYNPSGDGKTGGNPGGLYASTGPTFTNGVNALRGHLAEYKWVGATPSVAVLNGTPTTASGGAGTTSFPITSPSGALAGDLGIALWEDFFSVASTGSWSGPSGTWAVDRTQAAAVQGNAWAAYWNGLVAGAQTATAGYSTSASQVGWAAIFAAFSPQGLINTTGALTLAPLALSSSGTSAVPAGTVVMNGGLALAPLAIQSPSQAITFPAQPLPVTVEILVNGTWADITSYVYQRDGITITDRGRPNEASTAQPAQCTLTLNNRDGSFSPANTAGQFYPWLARNTQIRVGVSNAVTPQGAWYSGYRFWGSVPAWPPLWDPTGSDVYVSITAAGALQRMRQSKYSASPVTRYYTNIINTGFGTGVTSALAPAGYWPCEDGVNSGSFASGLPGGSPMTWTGTPFLGATDSSGTGGANQLPGVSGFAQLNSSVWTGTPGAFSSGGITYANPGTYTWTCPGGVVSVKAECWGGGGGGADGIYGSGGGGGEYAAENTLAVTPGTTYTVVVGAGGAGGAGATNSSAGGRGAQPVAAGASSTFTGDTVTVTAHGGKGGRNSNSGTAAGGTGSTNTVHHNGGAGGQSGGGPLGGSGGGSSGGTSAAGNSGAVPVGNIGAAGGAAVTGGGPGGKGGNGAFGNRNSTGAGSIPSPGPGGGGGGGGFSQVDDYGRAGGGGAPGQVTLTFGTSATPPAVVVRAVLDVPAAGATDQSQPLQAVTNGTVATLNLTYHTGGKLQLIGRDSGLNALFDSGQVAFGVNGTPMLVSCELTPGNQKTQALGTINWKLTALKPGAAAVVATAKGSFTQSVPTAFLGSVTQVNVNNAAGHTDTTATGVGQVSVQYAVDPILNLSQALNAYTGERAATRFLRLCGEQRVPAALTGAVSDTPFMGPQPAGLLVDLLQDCENTDLGQMFERRDTFGLGYATRASLQNQSPAAAFDYSLAHLAQGLAPTDDEQLIRNAIVATRAAGGTLYEVTQSTGALSVADPPAGVGFYQYQVTVNVQSDSQLVNFAQWLLTLGTVDEYRYPVITIDLSRAEVSDGTFSAAAALDIGGFLQIANPPSWLPAGPVNQLAFGFSETLNAYTWVIQINAVPEDPYTSSPGTVLPTW